MHCDEALQHLNARTDGELSVRQAEQLAHHLAECPSCRTAAAGLPALDADLRHVFASRRAAAARLAERTIAAVRLAGDLPAPQAKPFTPARSFAWAQALLALAAGFLLAIVIFRPWQSPQAPPAAVAMRPPIARLAVASAPVEVQVANLIPVLKCPESTPIARDSIVRTGATERCEIALDPGNAVRLDCNSEVALREAEVVEVKQGRIWLGCDSERSGVEIQAGGGTIVARKPAQLAVDCQPDATRLMVIDGTARVRTVEGARQVDAGKQVRIVQGKVEDDPEWRDALVETAWVNSLLALRREDHPELVARVDQLLARIGAVKLSLLYEDELRRLGDGGVPPLLAYLDSTRDTPQIAQRATAARIAADVSETSRIADLIALLTDPHAEVRFHAARGLERLTGRNQGIDPQAWQSQTWAACEPVHQKWIDWWAANRDRYPHARREITSPTSPPF